MRVSEWQMCKGEAGCWYGGATVPAPRPRLRAVSSAVCRTNCRLCSVRLQWPTALSTTVLHALSLTSELLHLPSLPKTKLLEPIVQN